MQAFQFLVHTISVFYGNMVTIGNSMGYTMNAAHDIEYIVTFVDVYQSIVY